jgi:hypothetical protein
MHRGNAGAGSIAPLHAVGRSATHDPGAREHMHVLNPTRKSPLLIDRSEDGRYR